MAGNKLVGRALHNYIITKKAEQKEQNFFFIWG
jgi:hypothetical protein